MHDILQYEEKLIKTRLELNDLIEKYSNNKENIDKAIIENKIEYLTKELDYLNNQLNLLKLSVENETEHNNTYSVMVVKGKNIVYMGYSVPLAYDDAKIVDFYYRH